MSRDDCTTVWVKKKQKEELFALQCHLLLKHNHDVVQVLLDNYFATNGNREALEVVPHA